MRPEVRALEQLRLDGERGALEREIVLVKALRRQRQAGGEVFPQPRKHRLLQRLLDRLPVAFRLARPVGAALQVRDG